jgi:hypothetical protein
VSAGSWVMLAVIASIVLGGVVFVCREPRDKMPSAAAAANLYARRFTREALLSEQSAVHLAAARRAYVADRLTVDELEREIEFALALDDPASPLSAFTRQRPWLPQSERVS